MMNSFQHLASPLRFFQGNESLAHLAREMDRLGRQRAVIICGRSLAAHSSALGLVRGALGERCVGVFDGVRPHSPIPDVQQAAEALRTLQADAVVAVGGGSAIVTARAATIFLAEGMDPRRLCTQRTADGRMTSPKLLAPKLPQFVVPTTPTTACVKAGSAVFDSEKQERLAMFDPKTRAQALFVHPELVGTAPPELVLTASLNTLSMAVEGLESVKGNALSDAQLMHALRLLAQSLPLPGGADDDQARADLIVAAVLCGLGTDSAGGGIASVLGHAIGGRFHVENGIANAVLLPHTMRFNAPVTAARASKITLALGAAQFSDAGTASEQAIAAVERLLRKLSIPPRLRDIGVPHDALESVSEQAHSDWFLQNNPRRVTDPTEMTSLLQDAW